MNDCPDQEPIEFKQIKVGEFFCINDEDGDKVTFRRINYNKAINVETKEVSHFVDNAKVWSKDNEF